MHDEPLKPLVTIMELRNQPQIRAKCPSSSLERCDRMLAQCISCLVTSALELANCMLPLRFRPDKQAEYCHHTSRLLSMGLQHPPKS
eukprot:2189912-Amphidinium_carterae.1